MLKLFLTFLSYIIHNLIEYLETSKDETVSQDVFETYIMFQRIAYYLGEFSRILGVWQKDKCHGAAWSGCQGNLRRLNHAMRLLDSDLWRVVGGLGSDKQMILRCKLRGGPFVTKFDIFDIWLGLIERNAVDCFCGWRSDHTGEEVSRTLYIPNYSIILPVVQRTSELADYSKSQWRQIDFEFLSLEAEDLNRQALEFLPELPPEYPIDTERYTRLGKSFYTKVIPVPRQEQELIEIIDEAQRNVAEFYATINTLRDVLIAQANGEMEKVLKVL